MIRRMTYTKDNGEQSDRIVFVVSKPRENYLCYDVSEFSLEDIDFLEQVLKDAEALKEDLLFEFENETGHKIKNLWRSFKPSGVEWTDGK